MNLCISVFSDEILTLHPYLLMYAPLIYVQALVNSLEKKIDETEKKYEEANKISEERLKQALDAESKIVQLKTTMQRFFH